MREGGLQPLYPSLKAFPIANSHSCLARSCLSYIVMRDLDVLEKKETRGRITRLSYCEKADLFPLSSYAVENMLHHMEAASAEGISQVSVLQVLQQCCKGARRLKLVANAWYCLEWKGNTKH